MKRSDILDAATKEPRDQSLTLKLTRSEMALVTKAVRKNQRQYPRLTVTGLSREFVLAGARELVRDSDE